jgi:dTDP-4-amino-4,6-dideoxygalactose transaminase
MDEIQAALLSAELPHLQGWLKRRREIAAFYDDSLDPEVFVRPRASSQSLAARHLYVVRVRKREAFREFMDREGIDTGVHYPSAISAQPAYRSLGYERGCLPVTEALCREITSLPVAPHLTDGEVERVARACRRYVDSLAT